MKQNYIFLKLLSVLIFIYFSSSSLAAGHFVSGNRHHHRSHLRPHLTITNGIQSEIKIVLKNKNTKLEARDSFHRTPIHISVQKQDIRTTQRLINLGVNVDTQDYQGVTIAHIAAKLNDVDLLEVILEANPNLDLINNIGRNAFLTGVHEGHIGITQAFIKHQPELLNSKDVNGMTGTQIASKNNKPSMIEALKELEAGTPKIQNLNGSEVDTQFQDKKERLINNFYMAIENGHQNVVQTLYNNNPELIDITQEGRTALHEAAYHTRSKMIQLLLKWGFDANKLNSQGWPAFLTAVKTGDIPTAQQFTNYDLKSIELTAGNIEQTAAHIVVLEAKRSKYKTQRWTKMLRWLVEQGINLQTKNKLGQTAYDLAKITKQTYLFSISEVKNCRKAF